MPLAVEHFAITAINCPVSPKCAQSGLMDSLEPAMPLILSSNWVEISNRCFVDMLSLCKMPVPLDLSPV